MKGLGTQEVISLGLSPGGNRKTNKQTIFLASFQLPYLHQLWHGEMSAREQLHCFFAQKSAASRKAQNGAGHQWAALVGDSLEVRIIKLLKPVTRSC